MYIRPSAKDLWCYIWIVIFFVGFSGLAYGGGRDNVAWKSLESKYTIIHYQSSEDLKKFDRKIDYSPAEWGRGSLFSGSGSGSDIEKLKKKMDALYTRVQQILDMRKKMKKIKIKIYKGKRQLHSAFKRIYKRERKNIRVWYIFEYNTIYVNVDDLHEGMLAHEMAHSIIDHYLTVRPPSKSAEILARYVDKHLVK